MSIPFASSPKLATVSTRLARLVALEPAELEALRAAEGARRRFVARREMVMKGEPVRERRAVVNGWTCRQRILPDGRRQILSMLLPGDLMDSYGHDAPLAPASILAITDGSSCALPAATAKSRLAEAFARSAALSQRYDLAHITRLGRFNAYERLIDWLLEIRERLHMSGSASDDMMPLPLTQEMLADALGLTAVHLNRTVQGLRRDGLIEWRSGVFFFQDRKRLEVLVDYEAPRISAR